MRLHHAFVIRLLAVGLAAAPAGPAVSLTPLDGGRSVVPHVHVLAMAVSPDGTLYAGGRDTSEPRSRGQANPSGVGSALVISHDHGMHWSTRVSDEPLWSAAVVPPWTDRTRWPANFTVWQLVVDARRPGTVYAAGGFAFGHAERGGVHLLLRSTDSGRTWSDLLVWRLNWTAHAPLRTNIVASPADRLGLVYRRVHNAQALAIDPHNPRHLYLGTDELGVLRSTDGGTTWRYNAASPSVAPHVSEHLVLDPRQPVTLYLLVQDTTMAFLYRTDDGATTWHQIWHGGFAGGLFLEGRTLYLAREDGIYASTDRGGHWRRAVNGRALPAFTRSFAQAGVVLQVWHDPRTGVWHVVADNPMGADVSGLYATTDGGSTWQRLSDGLRGPQKVPALALGDMAEGYTRIWLDEGVHPHVLFTAGDQEGLYRWSLRP